MTESFEKNPKGKQKFYRENLLSSFMLKIFQKIVFRENDTLSLKTSKLNRLLDKLSMISSNIFKKP